MNQPIKHIIVNNPELQTHLFLYDEGPYNSVQMSEDNNYYYIVGKNAINCVSFPNDTYRTIWVKPMVDILIEELNKSRNTQNEQQANISQETENT